MTPVFRMALVCLVALAAGVGATWFLTRSDDPGSGTVHVSDAQPGTTPRTGRASDGPRPLTHAPGERRDGSPRLAGPVGRAPLSTRTPFGARYDDPAFRARKLTELLGAEEIQWGAVRDLLRIIDEPLDEESKRILLQHLRMGPRRQGALQAFQEIMDPSLIEGVFEILDHPGATMPVRRAALVALARMPGADDDAVATQLSSRLGGTWGEDVYVLQALAQRGGTEATRALVAYIEDAGDPTTIHGGALSQYKAVTTPESMDLVASALERASSAAVVERLLEVFVRPDMSELGEAVRKLDRSGLAGTTRSRIYEALARLGDPESVGHVLNRVQAGGTAGRRALASLQFLKRETATEATRVKVREMLRDADQLAEAVPVKQGLLRVLKRLRDAGAKEQIWDQVDDRDPRVANTAIEAMGSLGHHAQDRIEDIASLYDGADLARRTRVVGALGRIGGPQALETIQRWAKEPDLDPGLRSSILLALNTLNPEHGQAPRR